MGFFSRDKDENTIEKAKILAEETEEDTEEESEDEEDTYEVNVRCSNCTSSFTVEIPTGTLVSDFCALEKCDDCGCKNTLKLEE
jgi:hypothetical protein